MGRSVRLFISGLMLLSMVAGAQARTSDYDAWDEDYNVSALLGVVKYADLKFTFPDSASSERADLSLLPQLGGAWTTAPLGDRFQCGLETSFLMAFQADKLNYLSAGGGGLRISVSTSIWMFDLAGGAYASAYLDPKRYVRVYAGGGPLIMYASYRTKRDYSDGTDEESASESHFGVGGYARTGIECRIRENGMLGLGARGTWTRIDFSDVGGRSEMTGIAGFITYTVGF